MSLFQSAKEKSLAASRTDASAGERARGRVVRAAEGWRSVGIGLAQPAAPAAIARATVRHTGIERFGRRMSVAIAVIMTGWAASALLPNSCMRLNQVRSAGVTGVAKCDLTGPPPSLA